MHIPIEIVVLVLGVIFSSIGALIGIVLNALNKNTQAWDRIEDTVNSVLKWISVKDTEDKYESEKCETQHGYISNKLREHSVKLDNHETRLNKVEHEKSK